MNRFKKEEKARGFPFPTKKLTAEEFRELVNAAFEKRKPNLKKAREKKKSKLPK